MEASLLSLCILLFIIVDPLGNVPAILNLIKPFSHKRQIHILIRECLISLAIALFFQYFGEWFLTLIGIEEYVLRLSSGILILIVAIQMLFAQGMEDEDNENTTKQEPYVFPIATPLLSGPGLLAILMIQARSVNPMILSLALLIVWVSVFFVLLLAPFLQRLLGKNGLIAFEQVMGILVALVAMQLIVNGSVGLINSL